VDLSSYHVVCIGSEKTHKKIGSAAMNGSEKVSWKKCLHHSRDECLCTIGSKYAAASSVYMRIKLLEPSSSSSSSSSSSVGH
jgi:hypothetical protein